MKLNVVDSRNISYTIKQKLGEGSQGVTYLLEDERFIVKLFNKNFDDNSSKSKINFLIDLGLDKKVFAVPLKHITQPRNGYVAEFASGMIPLTAFSHGGVDVNLTEWYISTGGLLKRYKILIKLSAIMRTLHSKGLAYCDLSPNNVFISEKEDLDNVFLIDLDNLRYKTSILYNIYTPSYGAPEIISNLGPNTTMSDSYSFAVMAYELLTLNHPLMGDYVSEAEPEVEEQALAGKLPWVEDSSDNTNHRTTGLPSEKVMPGKLLNLFRKNFESGLNNPLERPSMAEWYDMLNLALNELLKCSSSTCGLRYPYNNFEECGFCGCKPKKVTRIQMRRWEQIEYYDDVNGDVKQKFVLEPTIYDEILIDENTPKEIAAFNFLLTEVEPSASLLKIEYLTENDELKILLTPLNEMNFNISPRTGVHERGKEIVLDSPKKIRVVDANQPEKQKYMLHLKDLSFPQRVLTID